jgi:microcompartment protein CcmL/EutN
MNMKQNSLGIVEYRSVAMGLAAEDEMLKTSGVSLLYASVLCAGKFLIMVSGDVTAVEEAVTAGMKKDTNTAISGTVVSNISEQIFPALSGVVAKPISGALGITETMDAVSAIEAADAAAKSAGITLLEIRLARGMGGKAFVFFCGNIPAVETAAEAAGRVAGKNGALIASAVIHSPHTELCF